MALTDASARPHQESPRPNVGDKTIPIARPILGEEEIQAVAEVLRSGELVQGRWVAQFEEAFAKTCNAQYAIATSSGTTALHVAMLAHGIGPGDEVITTAFTFIASTNAILYVGARPVFADIDPVSYTIDPDAIEALITPRTKAVLPVDLYGNPAHLERIQDICDRHGIALIDDASQAHGASINGKPIGSLGTACFSFYPSKNMTTAEGGMITTDRADVAEAARKLRHHGTQQTYIHDRVGFNFRMTNIQAAIGIVQLGHLANFNARRIANANYLTGRLPGITTPVVRAGTSHVFHQYTIRVPNQRDRLIDELKSRGIESRVYYPLPVHRQQAYNYLEFYDVQLPETDRAASEVLSLPVHPSVSEQELEHIATSVVELWP